MLNASSIKNVNDCNCNVLNGLEEIQEQEIN